MAASEKLAELLNRNAGLFQDCLQQRTRKFTGMHRHHGHPLARRFTQNDMTALLPFNHEGGSLGGRDNIFGSDARKPFNHRSSSSNRRAKDDSERDWRVGIRLLRERVPMLRRGLHIKLKRFCRVLDRLGVRQRP